jgi:hypothetical protein
MMQDGYALFGYFRLIFWRLFCSDKEIDIRAKKRQKISNDSTGI